MTSIRNILIAGTAALLCSCSGNNKWHLEGKINGLSTDDVAVIEGNNQGYWYPIDTLKISSDGSFKYAHDAQGYPDIYRLRVGDKSVYFPIDSIETVKLIAEAPAIDISAQLSGSPQVENLVKVDSLLLANYGNDPGSINADKSLKRELAQMILADPAGIVTYYIINKTIGGKSLYDASNKEDLRMIGAVANAFSQQRPSDPRTSYLKRLYISNRPTSSVNQRVANEIRALDINLYDNKGVKHSLLETTSKGNVVILNFTAYTAEESPALNLILNSIYEKYHSQGLEIYQVSFDSDEFAWREAAKNLPWITVFNGAADGDRALRDYNVGALPAIFIFDRNGDVVERVTDIASLESSVTRRM